MSVYYAPTRPLSPAAKHLQEQLRSSPYWSVRQLACDTSGDCVIVRGIVPSYYLKQVAQSLAMRIAGIGQVRSDIHVQSETSAKE
jgi:hypothetical protein